MFDAPDYGGDGFHGGDLDATFDAGGHGGHGHGGHALDHHAPHLSLAEMIGAAAMADAVSGHDHAGGGHIGHCFDGQSCHGFSISGGSHGIGHALGHGSRTVLAELHALSADRGGRGHHCPCLDGTKLSGFARSNKQLQLLVWPHGFYPIRDRLRSICENHGLFDIVKWYRDNNNNEGTSADLKDTTPFDGRDHSTGMPSGWYKGATGSTNTWSEYWQIGSRDPWWAFWQEPKPNYWWRTYLEIKGSTWYYDQIGDYETRVAFTIYTIASVDPATRAHVPRRKYINMHGRMANSIASILFANLLEISPTETAIRKRREKMEELSRPRVVEKKKGRRRKSDAPTADAAPPEVVINPPPVDPMTFENCG